MAKPLGHATIGWGHSCSQVERVLYAKGIMALKADELLVNDLKIVEKCLNSKVKVQLTQNQYDALVDFVFNTGIGAFMASTLLKCLNEGNIKRAGNQMLRWIFTTVNGKKVVSSSLMDRRERELKLYNDR